MKEVAQESEFMTDRVVGIRFGNITLIESSC
jgi:hypothetical protein